MTITPTNTPTPSSLAAEMMQRINHADDDDDDDDDEDSIKK